MLQVKHKITIGAAVYTPGAETRLRDLRMHADLAVPVNICRVVLSPPAGLSIAPTDAIKVELGYGDDLVPIFTGTASSVDWGVEGVMVFGASAFHALVTARFNLLYDKPKAGEIVSAVAGRLRLAKSAVEDGITFSSYALGENQTAYEHLRTLARQCGFDLYADAADKLVFAKYKAATTHGFSYGADILSFSLDKPAVQVTGVEVYGESPASHGQGAEASSWLTKKDVKGSAGGSSGIVMRVADPTARTQQSAAKIAEALLEVTAYKQRGVLKVLGAPSVKLGDAVSISKMPVQAQNGTFKVTGVTHTLHARQGFITKIAVQLT